MSVSIGILASVPLISRIKTYQHILKNENNIVLIPYENLNDVENLFIKNMPLVDAFLLGGELIFSKISDDLKSTVPCFYLTVSNEDLYKLFLKLIIENNKFDFSRTYIDFLNETNDYMGIKEILPKDNFPYTYYFKNDNTIYEKVLDKHIELWENGLIDISITRVGNLEKPLKDMGIKTFYISPSSKNVMNALAKAVNYVKIKNFEDSQITIGHISICDIKPHNTTFNYEEEVRLLALNKSLIDFQHEHNLPNSIVRNDINFEIIISKKILKELTGNYKYCSLLNYIKTSNTFNLNIGWGIGSTIMEARKRSISANIEANRYDKNCSFILNEQDQIIGPLSENICIHFIEHNNSDIELISSKTKLSSVTILKLIGITKKLNTNEVSSDDLSFYMGITIRSANRILNKLCKSGFAKSINKKSDKLVGRPKKIYLLYFDYNSKF
ncbi:hypothetical protein [Clostridium sp. 001]|uniref:hypothetical protein n=1 Tax=Clostridium sp. 001 TaxID=1970093 RepID=UPI001C2C9A6B|nr:hypothetical protein [Clostridium sp. 001]QXE21096.1 hypothetical protein B5S50_20810 [Clostridium sp. 001]